MATTTSEESAQAVAAVAPLQPDAESSIGPEADREEKEDEEDEEGGPGHESAQERSLDSDWVEERFRIDRKKLENMLYGE